MLWWLKDAFYLLRMHVNMTIVDGSWRAVQIKEAF